MSDIPPNHPEALEQHKSEHRALAVLRMLSRETSYMSNEEIIGAYLTTLGLGCLRAEVRTCLDQLEKHGLVESSKVDKLIVVRLRGKGEEAGNGLIEVSGVLRPDVECPY